LVRWRRIQLLRRRFHSLFVAPHMLPRCHVVGYDTIHRRSPFDTKTAHPTLYSERCCSPFSLELDHCTLFSFTRPTCPFPLKSETSCLPFQDLSLLPAPVSCLFYSSDEELLRFSSRSRLISSHFGCRTPDSDDSFSSVPV